MTSAAESIKSPNAVKAVVVHTIFQSDPYDPSSGPNPHYEYLCASPYEFGAIVFTTGAAGKDFRARYGGGDISFVIPHPYPYAPAKTEFDKRDHRKAVIVSRFDRVKQIDMAIEIFGAAAAELPDIRLEIYGFGDLSLDYAKQIERLGLKNNVFLMGVTDDPAAVFAGAALSMMTSMAEGFGITQVESVCNGCPVFAFDIKYGPSDIIVNEKTGFLFKPFDKRGFAGKLVTYFNDLSMQRTMSENAARDAARFGKEAFLEGWYNMTEHVIHRLKNRQA